jgi:hypothetical protein
MIMWVWRSDEEQDEEQELLLVAFGTKFHD